MTVLNRRRLDLTDFEYRMQTLQRDLRNAKAERELCMNYAWAWLQLALGYEAGGQWMTPGFTETMAVVRQQIDSMHVGVIRSPLVGDIIRSACIEASRDRVSAYDIDTADEVRKLFPLLFPDLRILEIKRLALEDKSVRMELGQLMKRPPFDASHPWRDREALAQAVSQVPEFNGYTYTLNDDERAEFARVVAKRIVDDYLVAEQIAQKSDRK